MILTVLVNIKTKPFTHSSKDDIFYLYSSLSIYYNSSIDIILSPYLVSFNHYLTKNISLSTQYLGQSLTAKLLKIA